MGSVMSGGDDVGEPIKEKAKVLDVKKGPGGMRREFKKHLHQPSEATLAFFWALLKTRGESFEGTDCSISGGFADLIKALPESWDGYTSAEAIESWKTDSWRGEAVLFFQEESASLTFIHTSAEHRLTPSDGYLLKMYLE
eukprot:TRINITY_DN44639_c0_g1_i1.p1 TRINITY_DN44639_c0_g1~~TRINITY_DN44639_c0_g1_i1.p1  ORF type:complete len:154 (+),score=46.39 TRINITY_DN44639_c0_g1_i1:43-462(+)